MSDALAISNLNKDKSAEDVSVESCNLYFSPESEEFFVITDKEFALEIENEVSNLSVLMEDVTLNKQKCDLLINEYLNLKNEDGVTDKILEEKIEDVDKAEEKLELSRNKLNEELQKMSEELEEEVKKNGAEYINEDLNTFECDTLEILSREKISKESELDKANRERCMLSSSGSKSSYSNMIELIPLKKRSAKEINKYKGAQGVSNLEKKFAYAKRSKFMWKNGKFNNMTLTSKDKRVGDKSIARMTNKGKFHLDKDLLKKQIKGLEKDFKLLNLSTSIIDESILSVYGTVKHGDSVDVSHNAQFLRYSSNMGGSTSFNDGKLSANLAIENSARLFNGVVKTSAYFPDAAGWELKYVIDKDNNAKLGNEINMGCIRASLSLELYGSLGVSLLINGNFNLDFSWFTSKNDDANKVTSKKFSQRQKNGVSVENKGHESGGSASANVFAGLELGAKIGGSLEWLKPLSYYDETNKDKTKEERQLLYAKNKYVSFCTIVQEFSFLAGAGVGKQFEICFENKKLLLKVGASYCMGFGAKGTFLFEVNANYLFEFVSWFAYQLHHSDYSKLSFISKDVFLYMTKLILLWYFNGYKKVFSMALESSDNIIKIIKEQYDKLLSGWIDSYKASKELNDFSIYINNNKEELLYLNPEAKAILLYKLTNANWLDAGRYENFDIYHNRKKAVINIIQSIQTVREWQKIMLRFNGEGKPLSNSPFITIREKNLISDSEKVILDFLMMGWNKHEIMLNYKEDLMNKDPGHRFIDSLSKEDLLFFVDDCNKLPYAISAVKKRLKSGPSLGLALTSNCSPGYFLKEEGDFLHKGKCDYAIKPTGLECEVFNSVY